jgi:hypothetical protein
MWVTLLHHQSKHVYWNYRATVDYKRSTPPMANEIRATHEYRPNPNVREDIMQTVQEQLSELLKTEVKIVTDEDEKAAD